MGTVLPFPASRRAQAAAPTVPCPPPDVERLPLAVQAHPGAVALHLPDTEFWLSTEQARELAVDLVMAAEVAERGTP